MKTEKKTIDGIEFEVTAFPAMEALKLLPYLGKKIAPAIGEAIGAFKGIGASKDDDIDIGNIELDGNSIGRALNDLFTKLDEETLVSLLKRILAFTNARLVNKEGRPIQVFFTPEYFETSLDLVFGGRVFSVFALVKFVLEVNYPDFFGLLAQGIGRKIAKTFTLEPADGNLKSASTQSAV